MSEVQRFRCYTEEAKSGSYGSMGESDQGDWVHFEDYERVMAERDLAISQRNSAFMAEDQTNGENSELMAERDDAVAELDSAKARCERLVGLLKEANALLIHMQAFYAPDLVGGEQVCKSQEFMASNGGTLWQLATMFDRIRKELGHGE